MHDFAIKRLRGLMEEQDLSSVLVTEGDNLEYLTGITDIAGWLLVEQDSTRLVTSKFFRYSPGVDAYYSGSDEREHLHSELRDAAQVTDMEMEDIEQTDLLTEARRIKTDEELEMMREAASIGDAAFGTLLERFGPGMTEWEAAAVVDERVRAGGARSSFDTLVHASTTEPHRSLRDDEITAGEPVLVDLGARYAGYCSDMTRMLPNACSGEQQELVDAVAQLQQLALENVRAGLDVAELAGLVEERVPELGYSVDDHYLHSLGHGVGVAIHEGPSLHTEADGELRENMVVTIEPGLYVPGTGGARIEDQIVVTDDGYERLTQQDRIYERD